MVRRSDVLQIGVIREVRSSIMNVSINIRYLYIKLML